MKKHLNQGSWIETVLCYEGKRTSVELDRKCKNCGMGFKQHVSFNKEDEKITIKVYRYKCPFCYAFVKKPTTEEVRKAPIIQETSRK